MNEPKKQIEKVIEHNIKTLYRPFKRCFKYPTNTVTKWIWNVINYDYKPIFMSEPFTGGEDRVKLSNSKGHTRVRYASIKGCCKLRREGNLV